MSFESWMYKNPEAVLIRKQEAAAKRKAKCGRCIHYQTLVLNFETHHGCTLKRRNWQACTYFETKKVSL